MQFRLGLAALLCFTTWMTVIPPTHGFMKNCCVRWYNTRVPLHLIVNYTIQAEGVCPIKAVLFESVHGKRLCSNPDNQWAKRAILKVDNERKALLEMGQNEEGSPNGMRPAASTTTTNPSTSRGMNGRKNEKGSTNGITPAASTTTTNPSPSNGRKNEEGSTNGITPAASTTTTNPSPSNGRKNEEGSTNDITPAVSTTTMNPSTSNGRKNEEGSTNGMTPAASTTTKKPSQRRGRYRRKKSLRRRRWGQRKCE